MSEDFQQRLNRQRFANDYQLVDGVAMHAENGDRFQLRVRSYPLIGANRAANKVIEQQRAEDLRRRLIESGIAEDRLTFELSGDMEQAGRGVEIVPDKVEP